NSYYSQVELKDDYILTNSGHIIGTKEKKYQSVPINGFFYFNTYTTNDSLLWYTQLIGPYPYLHNYNYKTSQTTKYHKIQTDENFGIVYSNKKLYVTAYEGFGELQQDSLNYLFRHKGLVSYDMAELSPGIIVVASCTNLIRFNTITNTVDTILSLPAS